MKAIFDLVAAHIELVAILGVFHSLLPVLILFVLKFFTFLFYFVGGGCFQNNVKLVHI